MEQKITKKNLSEQFAKVLSEYIFNVLTLKQSPEQAFKNTYKAISYQTGMKESNSANIVRMATALYIEDKDYFEKSLNSIKVE